MNTTATQSTQLKKMQAKPFIQFEVTLAHSLTHPLTHSLTHSLILFMPSGT